MKAVILAGGKGTRMLPLTLDKPKNMIPVNGKPFIDYVISSLKSAGIKEIALVANYKMDILEIHIQNNYEDIIIIDQKGSKGTGHAVLSAMNFAGEDDFIVIMGDNLYSSNDIKNTMNMKQNAVAGYEVPNPSAYGVLVTDGSKLLSIVEKPQHPPSNLINTGLYKFTPEIFPALKNIKVSVRGEYELPDAINILARAGKVNVYQLQDYWVDFGKPEDVVKMEEFLKKLRSRQ